MKRKYVLGTAALAMIAVLGISMVSAFGFGNGFIGIGLSDEEKSELQEQSEAIRIAVEDSNYDDWAALMEQRIDKMRDKITKDNFELVVQRHDEMSEVRELKEELKEAIADGDEDRIEELKVQIQELMPEGKAFGNGFRKGFGKGFRSGAMHGDCPYAEQ